MNGQPLILVVEQSLHDLELLNSHLGILNFSSICTKQGVRSVMLAQTHQPDLILLDMKLSNLSANQVIDDLKHDSKTATIPIIAVTPLRTVQDDRSTMLTAFDDCITKPYDFNQLEVVISRHISQLNS
ncbi:two-component system response regulator [Nostoc sp. 'Peltigera membranacea cyanobiont' 210A]|uniref:response regulator n=1 Tax=Nostoc sp. 'Peltigera membranacea cyanobiont' 210A TaxID=2014529 RepID=UPI000B9511F8|nr:response regulator [Nostoc sp. 'Peltigera membranacea cyanobiont' 210A]OYD92050.1 two-component system response regulator [Nostoc sp. 'Peltigera membranacea cyanobiont' 210A]